MTPKEWAALLNGREYRAEVTNAEAKQAAADGIVIVHGGSDDWWQRSLARLGVQPRADNDAPVMMDMVADIQRYADQNDSLHYHYNTLKAFGGQHV